jgi:hypothetical protein
MVLVVLAFIATEFIEEVSINQSLVVAYRKELRVVVIEEVRIKETALVDLIETLSSIDLVAIKLRAC